MWKAASIFALGVSLSVFAQPGDSETKSCLGAMLRYVPTADIRGRYFTLLESAPRIGSHDGTVQQVELVYVSVNPTGDRGFPRSSAGRHLVGFLSPADQELVHRRQMEMARQGFVLLNSSWDDGKLRLVFELNKDLDFEDEFHEPDYVATQEEQMARKYPVLAEKIQDKGERIASNMLPLGVPLTAKTLPHIQDGTYVYVGLVGENFLRLAPEGRYHYEVGAGEDAWVAGEITIKGGDVVAISLQSATYLPSVNSSPHAVHNLWEQGVYPRNLVIRLYGSAVLMKVTDGPAPATSAK